MLLTIVYHVLCFSLRAGTIKLMTTFLLLVLLAVLAVLLGVAALSPNVSALSNFELARRSKKGDSSVANDMLREQMFQDVISVQRATLALLLVLFALLSITVLGAFFGSLLAVIIALEYGALARIKTVRAISQKTYDTYEHAILLFLSKHQSAMKWLRSVTPHARDERIDSKEELVELVSNSHGVLSDTEKTQLLSSLQFENKIVRNIMTPKSVVDTIPGHEILGPLVLDSLHKTGHSRFPVINGDIDHVVGILYLRDVLTIDTAKKHTARVETAMSKKVYYIREDHTLSQALSAFLSAHHHLFIVINEFRETVGIVTLEDTLEALLGRRIIDEFDAHDDMRAVAERQASKKSNQPKGASEV